MKPAWLLVFLLTAVVLPVRAEDWTTVDGKSYKNVKVLKVEDDAVTILDSEGGARLPLASLPADLQKKFNYDSAKAEVAAAAYKSQQRQADAEYVREKQNQYAKDAAKAKADDDAAAASAEQASKDQAEHGVKASDIEALCAMVHLDEQAKANEVTTSVVGGNVWRPSTATTGAAVAADNHGNVAAGVAESITYTNAPNASVERRREQRGLPDLWAPAIPAAAALLERPCTAEQTQWLNTFIACAKLAGGTSTDYGTLLQSLVQRPGAPPWGTANSP